MEVNNEHIKITELFIKIKLLCNAFGFWMGYTHSHMHTDRQTNTVLSFRFDLYLWSFVLVPLTHVASSSSQFSV